MSLRTLMVAVAAGVALLAGATLLPRLRAPTFSERVTAEEIRAALVREADTTFVVTGYLEVTATVRSRDTRVLLPDLLNLPLGTTVATVRVPGRVSYGFDVEALRPEMIRVGEGSLDVELPPIVLYSTEPDLSRLEVETTTGWLRRAVTAQEAERRAVQFLNEALEQQGTAHLGSSMQPQVNTARALWRLLEPVAMGLGMVNPRIRIHLGDGLVLEQ